MPTRLVLIKVKWLWRPLAFLHCCHLMNSWGQCIVHYRVVPFIVNVLQNLFRYGIDWNFDMLLNKVLSTTVILYSVFKNWAISCQKIQICKRTLIFLTISTRPQGACKQVFVWDSPQKSWKSQKFEAAEKKCLAHLLILPWKNQQFDQFLVLTGR